MTGVLPRQAGGSALDRLRGPGPGKRHNARTIAALTANPGCSRRAVLDAAGVDKPKLAQHIGFPASFGQSRFALARGNGFEAMLKADGCALLLGDPRRRGRRRSATTTSARTATTRSAPGTPAPATCWPAPARPA